MAKQGIDTFRVVGVAIRTNDNIEKSTKAKIPVLWSRFENERIQDKVPNKKPGSLVYAVYTEYRGDSPEEYTFVLGVEVEDFSNVPEGMIGKTVQSAQYEVMEVDNESLKQRLPRVWVELDKASSERLYDTDFEAHDIQQGIVKAYIGVS